MIRLEYRNQRVNSKNHSVPENLRHKYARTTYNPDEEIENRWVTKTKEQAKRDKEMERRKKRNEEKEQKIIMRRYVQRLIEIDSVSFNFNVN